MRKILLMKMKKNRMIHVSFKIHLWLVRKMQM